MKKLLLSITFLLISTLNYSQNSKIKIGVQAGLNYSNLRGYDIPVQFEPFYSESPAFSFLGGLNFEYQMKEKLSLKLELNYERKSQKGDNNIEVTDTNDFSQNYNFTSKKNYDYLVLPIMLKYNFSNTNSFYVNGGPFIGYLLKSNLTNDLEKIDGLNNDPVETTNLNNKTDFGLSIGLGKTIEINEKNSIFIEIRENLGLSNTSKNKVWGNGEVKTNSLNLIIGYSIN
ncbi:outer membrane protein with beta-barrel domain [Flavobacterium tiangeerense]|uniref:Outer membrane protein with beta-barrel domain n=1 Tax=Flavobacterium tiangeerense TaxID=459471 RepID=A0ABY3FP28_9FLAO|nr:porin family protein [Flavobacterium tiangeerense]TWI03310.1 outer membrane protein with beta-barrel domain [Flavobacterium tiangeerense]